MTRIPCRSTALLVPFMALSALAQPVITVQEYGEAPRDEIRYQFTPDATARATMTMNMQMSMSMGAMQMPSTPIPAIGVPITMRTTEVRGDGSARYEFEFGTPVIAEGSGGNPALAQMLESSLAAIAGSTGWYRIDSRGNLLESSFNVPAGTPDQTGQMINEMQNQMYQLSAPFPAEAVGAGARWQLTTSVIISGAPLMMTTGYTLLRRDGDIVELGLTIDQATAAAPAPVPGVPSGTEATVSTNDGGGTGKMTIDLKTMLPTMEMSSSSTTSMGMQMQGQAQNMTMAMQMTMSITPQ
jgi:hypothetical protein